MKSLTTLCLALLTMTAAAQISYPYNPDENADTFISTPDLMEFLVVFGYEFEPAEIQVDSIPLSMYLSSLEAMIEANALPQGTTPGQFLQWNGEEWQLVMPKVGCTLVEACNYDATSNVLDEDKCVMPGTLNDCGCSDIPEGECDCEGNVLDALGVCGGTCSEDADGDGICDDGDLCIGEADECGVCNGPGAVNECGCTGIPEGDCDCGGNQVDVLGVCGGDCVADTDGDGVCDTEDDCVGEFDACGVCNGLGSVLECGCAPIPEGQCDCGGNVLDAVGTCGGACQNDFNGDGICDDDSLPGCTNAFACNYDPSAILEDGSCDYATCYGCSDPLACNFSALVTNDTGTCAFPGCNDASACNYQPEAGCDDGSCTYPGCTEASACNYDIGAGCDDGTCIFPNDYCSNPEACNYSGEAPLVCGSEFCIFPGCDDPEAINFDDTVCSGGECLYAGCTAFNSCNFNPVATIDDGSCEFECPGCLDPMACDYNPFATASEPCLCLTVEVSVTAGSYPGEVSWTIQDAQENLLLSGGSPFSGQVDLIQGNTYTLYANDSFGDSWHGNNWLRLSFDGQEFFAYTLTSCCSEIVTFTVPNLD